MKTVFFSVRSRRQTVLLIIVLVITILAINVAPAFALQYWRAGRENKSSGTSIRWTGGHGYNKVVNNPYITNDHVNSMYISRVGAGSKDYYEVGWHRHPGESNGQWFWAKMQNGVFYGPYNAGGAASNNSDHLLSVQIESNGYAQMKVDSTIIKQVWSNFYPDGVIVWGSERQNRNEGNDGHFWHLMKRRHDYSWVLWEIQGEYFWPAGWIPVADPDYHYHEVSEYEAYSMSN